MATKSKCDSKTYSSLMIWRSFRWQLVIEGIIIGLFVGLTVVIFRYMLDMANVWRGRLYQYLTTHGIGPTLGWFLALVVIAYVVGWLVKKEPLISGSGIPQVKGALLQQLKMNWLRVIFGKFIGGVLAIGAGLSLGREGPSVQIGAAIGQGVSRLFRRLKLEEKYLITSGASAGLAAAFNAPLAGVIFALEELHKNFSPLVLTSAMAASLAADFVSQQFFGQKSMFNFHELSTLPLDYYLYLIGLGLVIGVLGVIFNSSLIKTLKIFGEQTWLPVELKPLIPLVLGGILGFVMPEALGGGHHLINTLQAGKLTAAFMLVLVLVKFAFTMISYGSGVPGGIFLPLLVIGALAGDLYGMAMVNLVHIDPQYINNFIVLAMAAYFTAIVKAPITGSILITEMTGSFNHLLALTTVSMTAYWVTDVLNSKPIYELLLERTLKEKKCPSFVGDNKSKLIMEIAVNMGSPIENKQIKSIKWPAHCLLVGVKRGEQEIIPKGDTQIFAGDYLIVLTNDDQAGKVKNALLQLAEERDSPHY